MQIYDMPTIYDTDNTRLYIFYITVYTVVYCMYTLHYSSNKIKFSIQGNILKINITQYLRKNEIPLDLTLVRFFL